MKKHLKKIMGAGFGVVLLLGTINAVIINHQTEFSGVTYIKGLDEMYGFTRPGRVLATNSSWKRIESESSSPEPIQDSGYIAQEEAPSAIAEDLELELVEVVNPKIWAKGLLNTDFSGELFTSNGTIETLNVQLPGKEEISISFAEMNGNVFKYDYAGEIYSGMFYQVDPKSYMVTLTNGPLEGTRLRFVQEFTPEQVEISETLKRDHNIEVGFFGDQQKVPAKEEKKIINMDAQV